MNVLLWKYGVCRGIEPMVELEGCHALLAIAVMPAGVRT